MRCETYQNTCDTHTKRENQKNVCWHSMFLSCWKAVRCETEKSWCKIAIVMYHFFTVGLVLFSISGLSFLDLAFGFSRLSQLTKVCFLIFKIMFLIFELCFLILRHMFFATQRYVFWYVTSAILQFRILQNVKMIYH